MKRQPNTNRSFHFWKKQRTDLWRVAKASAIVTTLFLVVGISSFCQQSEGVDGGTIDALLESVPVSENPARLLDELDRFCVGNQEELPAAFSGEIGVPSGARNVMYSSPGIVGYSMSGSARSILELCSEQMKERGWSCVLSQEAFECSCFKGSGEYSRAFLLCNQVGDLVSVVIQFE